CPPSRGAWPGRGIPAPGCAGSRRSPTAASAAPGRRPAPAGRVARRVAAARAEPARRPSAPEYPALAMRRGWEGTVLLRVHVLASGSPSEIQVQKSSGREALDQAAVKAVKRWSFVPAKRGDKAEDGWVSVPIDFKLN
ncbi:energy transducer TonB, partial [Pseudomonas aeruginosa]|uniref:energy transducer TonB n=1 Tax=Pseudomonas aeruginosa TaxID=287 RepID=UPI003F824AD5